MRIQGHDEGDFERRCPTCARGFQSIGSNSPASPPLANFKGERQHCGAKIGAGSGWLATMTIGLINHRSVARKRRDGGELAISNITAPLPHWRATERILGRLPCERNLCRGMTTPTTVVANYDKANGARGVGLRRRRWQQQQGQGDAARANSIRNLNLNRCLCLLEYKAPRAWTRARDRASNDDGGGGCC